MSKAPHGDSWGKKTEEKSHGKPMNWVLNIL